MSLSLHESLNGSHEALAPELKHSEVWGDSPPEKIVIASASLRKALMVFWWMNDFDFSQVPDFFRDRGVDLPLDPSMTTMEYLEVIEQKIQNGDGALKERVSLGKLYGVEVIVEPQTGEGSDNSSPETQSRQKIKSVASLPDYHGRDIVFVASDSVGLMDGEHRGKPRNDSQFPDLKNLGEAEVATLLADFERWYLLKYYVGAPVGEFALWQQNPTSDYAEADSVIPMGKHETHVNTLLMKRGDEERVVTTTLDFDIPSPVEILARLRVYLESGGGGITQQLVDWLANLIDQISDDHMREALSEIPESKLKWYLSFHIMGVPVWEANAFFNRN